MRIIVQRPPADYQGPDIIDALLTSDIAALARGRREINRACSHRTIVRGNCPLLPYLATGSLLHLTQASGRSLGKLTAHAITIDISEDGRDFTATSAISIEKEGLS